MTSQIAVPYSQAPIAAASDGTPTREWFRFFGNLAAPLQAGQGVTGTFTTADSKIVTVTNGIITKIV